MQAQSRRFPAIDRSRIPDVTLNAADSADVLIADRRPGGERIRVIPELGF